MTSSRHTLRDYQAAAPSRSLSSRPGQERFFSAVSQRVSKRPIWLGDAAAPKAALPPTIQRIAGS